jgi:superfamily I DNA/RNA helicase
VNRWRRAERWGQGDGAWIAEVAQALKAERRETPGIEVRVSSAGEVSERLWKVEVQANEPLAPDLRGSEIRRSIEQSTATETVFVGRIVEVEGDTVWVRIPAASGVPSPGRARITPLDGWRSVARFMDRVRQGALWGDLGSQVTQVLAAAAGEMSLDVVASPPGIPPELARRWGLVWGPPGTGKTRLLIDLVARLLKDPDERLLILAPTHRALDEIGERLGKTGLAGIVRAGLPRDPRLRGSRFVEGLSDDYYDLLDALLGASQPEHSAPIYARLQDHAGPTVEALAERDDVRVVLATVQAGQRGVGEGGTLDRIREGAAQFTTVLIDEAGMVPRVSAALCALYAGRRVWLFGDPQQLSPISRAQRTRDPQVMNWLATSAMGHLSPAGVEPNVLRLRAQHRMHPEIREVVAALAYGGDLTDAQPPAPWVFAPRMAGRAFWYRLDAHGHAGSARAEPRGRTRQMTTAAIDALVEAFPFLKPGSSHSVLILTPYRAHRELLQAALRERGLQWRCSTIHAAQGQEADVVLFDTVHAASTAWSPEEWLRLVTVGLSRAKQAVFLLASEAEMNRSWLAPARAKLRQGFAKGGRWIAEAEGLFTAPARPAAMWVAEPGVRVAARGGRRGLRAQIDHIQAERPILTAEQEALVHMDLHKRGPRLVRGVAGSGKSLILAHWAVRLLRGQGVDRVTVVVANVAARTLVLGLLERVWQEQNRGQTPPHGRWSVVVMDQLLTELEREYGLPTPEGDEVWAYDTRARELLTRTVLATRFTACHVDEAQDIGPDGLRLLAALTLSDPEFGPNLHIFYDDGQNVYGRPRPTWVDLGLRLTGRSHILRESHRTTRAIMSLALNLVHRVQPLEKEMLHELMAGDGLTGVAGSWNAVFCASDGESPQVRVFDDPLAEEAWVVETIRELIQVQGLSPGMIRVVTLNGTLRTRLARLLQGQGISAEHRANRSSELGFGDPDKVLVTTPHSIKGWDAEVVLVPGVDRFYRDDQRGPEVERLLQPAALWVALTRARTRLYLSAVRAEDGCGATLYQAVSAFVEPV